MAKKKIDPERKPDLNETDDQAEIEARIKEMMDLDEPKSSAKSISVSMHDEDGTVSAPELPGAKKGLSIKVVDHNESEISDSAESEVPDTHEPENDPEVLAAIEEANKQLLNKEDDISEDVVATEEPTEDSAAEDEEDNLTASAPELGTSSEEADTSESSEDEETESAHEGVNPKEKPLKHLDSIVPKTKVEETIESPTTESAVDDIITKESDALLEAEDEKIAEAFHPEPKTSLGKKIAGIFKKKGVRRSLLFLLVVGLAAAVLYPSSRYLILNTAGVRSTASVTVLDESTQQPLKGVTVTLGELEQKTDQAGRAAFNDVKLGETDLGIEKRAFAPVSQEIIIGWGSNPLSDVSLKPTGSQYEFIVTDFLSGKPVAKVEAVSDDASALSNENGEIKLTIDQQDDSAREVVITGEGYRPEKFPLNLDQKEPMAVKLVPIRKHVFISNRSGRYDVYKVDIDGQNEKLILPGTGSERDDMVLISHPTDEVAALVSTKDNKRNKDGFLLSTLTVVNLEEDISKSVATSERVQVIDWIDSKIVYVQIKEGASGDSPDRHKLMSYDYKTGENKELASSNYFNDVLIAGKQIYIAPSSTNSQGASANLVKISADGGSKQTVINKEVWNIFRTSYDRLNMAVQQDWYELKLGENQAGKISGEPPSQTSRIYVDSPDQKRALWVENRDGKGVLLAYDVESNKDNTVRTQGGLKQPVRWLSNNSIVYRINTESETADYAMNLDGGEPVKIRDVANTSGINTWYYY
jgi:hypothetical protein